MRKQTVEEAAKAISISIDEYLGKIKIRYSHYDNDLMYGYYNNGECELSTIDVEDLAEHIAGAQWQREQGIEWVLERLPSEDTGRAGCTYNDTEYDSLTVVYGYNLALQHVREILANLPKTDK
jgi:hypothetical protein